jgi:hypothetical protein
VTPRKERFAGFSDHVGRRWAERQKVFGLSLSAHVGLLRQAGFARAGPVRQYGTGYVVVATRQAT